MVRRATFPSIERTFEPEKSLTLGKWPKRVDALVEPGRAYR